MQIDLTIPVRLISLANERMHYRVRARLAKSQRNSAMMHVAGALSRRGPNDAMFPLPLPVVFTRIGKKMLDSDNLAHCFKHVQDGVCDALHVDDGDMDRIRFTYQQEIGKEYGLRIQIGAESDSGVQTTRDPLQIPALKPAATIRAEPCSANPTKKSRPVKKSTGIWGDRA